MKTCAKCKSSKELDHFSKNNHQKDGLHNWCKECVNQNNKLWRVKKENHIKEYSKQYAQTPSGRESIKNARINYIKSGNLNLYHKNRRIVDIDFKITSILRNRIYQALKNNSKSASTAQLLGCSLNFFKLYIESQFEAGMSWDNYGIWDIDHYTPTSRFDLSISENQFICFNYLNLRPMWSDENRWRKRDLIPNDSIDLIAKIMQTL